MRTILFVLLGVISCDKVGWWGASIVGAAYVLSWISEEGQSKVRMGMGRKIVFLVPITAGFVAGPFIGWQPLVLYAKILLTVVMIGGLAMSPMLLLPDPFYRLASVKKRWFSKCKLNHQG